MSCAHSCRGERLDCAAHAVQSVKILYCWKTASIWSLSCRRCTAYPPPRALRREQLESLKVLGAWICCRSAANAENFPRSGRHRVRASTHSIQTGLFNQILMPIVKRVIFANNCCYLHFFSFNLHLNFPHQFIRLRKLKPALILNFLSDIINNRPFIITNDKFPIIL